MLNHRPTKFDVFLRWFFIILFLGLLNDLILAVGFHLFLPNNTHQSAPKVQPTKSPEVYSDEDYIQRPTVVPSPTPTTTPSAYR